MMKYDLSANNMLFDGDIKAKADKSSILFQVDGHLLPEEVLHDLSNDTDLNSPCIVIDFMSVIRSISKESNLRKFKELLEYIVKSAKLVCPSTMMQFIFDSYVDLTVKDSEKIRRGTSIAYELADIRPTTTLPSMMEKFWESESNKSKLVSCAYDYYLAHPLKQFYEIVCSGYLKQDEEIRNKNIYLRRTYTIPTKSRSGYASNAAYIYWALSNSFDSFVVFCGMIGIFWYC